MRTISAERAQGRGNTQSLRSALLKAGLSEADLERGPVADAISVAGNAFGGLLKGARHTTRTELAKQTILNALGLPKGSPAAQLDLEDDLNKAGVPMGDIMTVEGNITKALISHR